MKKLKLHNDSYKILLSDFKQWLDILGYAESSVYGMPIKLQEFFYWLECHGHSDLSKVTPKDIKKYYEALKQRANERRGGGLSKSYLNKHQNALRKFRNYLIQHNATTPLRIHLKYETNATEERNNILTQSEIKALFVATAYSNTHECIRMRDKALLVCLYSCGLRRNEAIQLDLKDILFDKQRIHVRKGKNYKERFVPLNRYNLHILEDYIYNVRHDFYKAAQNEALFIGMQGTRLCGVTVLDRIKTIANATGDKSIIEKNISPHTLRHSIATHLLQQGVPIESIKTFLGHSSLVSTQVYTHLLKTITDEDF
jgi:integrase/recombinase XerD